MNPLKALRNNGQPVWLDYVRRDLLNSGGLKKLIEDDGVMGVTSNPAIFEKAIGGSTEYVGDIQHAADTLRSVHESSKKEDGYISLEVRPYLAMKTDEGTASGVPAI